MRFCFNETLETTDLITDVMLCNKHGYDSIEIRISYMQSYLKEHSSEDLKKLLLNSNLKPVAFNSIDNINFTPPTEWKNILEVFLFCCRQCKEIENPYIILCPTESYEVSAKAKEDIFEDSVKVLTTLSYIAEPYGAKIAFEPIGNRRWCVRSLDEAYRIVQAVNRDNVGLTLDVMNLFCYDGMQDLSTLKEIDINKVFVVHINDAVDLPIDLLEPEQHRVLPGDGVIPLKEFFEILYKKGYKGDVSLELFGDICRKPNPEDVISDGIYKMKKVLQPIVS